jgi:hypothetical protein
MAQAVWKVTYRVTARWSKRQNLAIAVGKRVTSCVVSSIPGFFLAISLRCSLSVLFGDLSRVIAPNLTTAAAALEGRQEVAVLVVLARNAIAAARLVTLRVRAPRRLEAEVEVEAVQEATAVEATVVLGAAVAVAGAVKKHGALSHVSCLVASPEGY